VSAGDVLYQFSFPLAVYGSMTLLVTPEEESLIIQQGAPLILSATAQDRDGSAILPENIVWNSHLNGFLANGTELDLGSETLPELAIGEHIITIEAKGLDGGVVSVLKKIQINPAPEIQGEGSSAPEGTSDTPEGDSEQETVTRENLTYAIQIDNTGASTIKAMDADAPDWVQQ
jgi:hypothetical protein